VQIQCKSPLPLMAERAYIELNTDQRSPITRDTGGNVKILER
jgi:hypothetical protein